MTRFTAAVWPSPTGFGATLAAANCDRAWHGPFPGFWSIDCAMAAEAGATGDESADRRGGAAPGSGLRPVAGIGACRPSRRSGSAGPFGVRPHPNRSSSTPSSRPRPRFWRAGFGMFYGLAALSVAGTVDPAPQARSSASPALPSGPTCHHRAGHLRDNPVPGCPSSGPGPAGRRRLDGLLTDGRRSTPALRRRRRDRQPALAGSRAPSIPVEPRRPELGLRRGAAGARLIGEDYSRAASISGPGSTSRPLSPSLMASRCPSMGWPRPECHAALGDRQSPAFVGRGGHQGPGPVVQVDQGLVATRPGRCNQPWHAIVRPPGPPTGGVRRLRRPPRPADPGWRSRSRTRTRRAGRSACRDQASDRDRPEASGRAPSPGWKRSSTPGGDHRHLPGARPRLAEDRPPGGLREGHHGVPAQSGGASLRSTTFPGGTAVAAGRGPTCRHGRGAGTPPGGAAPTPATRRACRSRSPPRRPAAPGAGPHRPRPWPGRCR